MGCHNHKLGTKCIFTTDMTNFSICHDVDGEFYAHCSKVESIDYKLDGCKFIHEEKDARHVVGSKYTILKPISQEVQLDDQMKGSECQPSEGLNTATKLRNWIMQFEDTMLMWHQFTTEYNPFDSSYPMLELAFPNYQGRTGFKEKKYTIFSAGGLLLHQGSMLNGHIKSDIDADAANHPGWRTRLIICLDASQIQLTNNPLELSRQSMKTSDIYMNGNIDESNSNPIELLNWCPLLVRGSLKNGKLHGVVQIFGKVANDKVSTCSDSTQKSLAFVGRYADGIPVGPCWQGLIGGSWLHGIVNPRGEFTGKQIAYIYQDLELAMVGDFENGKMVCLVFLIRKAYSILK